MGQLYAGLDLHRDYSYLTVMDGIGEIKYQGKHKHLDQTLIPKLQSFEDNVTVAMESTYGWYAQADEFEKEEIAFVLAHPTKINAVAGKKKTDKEDAKILADLHRTKLLSQSYIPSKGSRDLRQLVRFRAQLVQKQSEVKVRLRDLLHKLRLKCPYTDILGTQSITWLTEQDYPPVYKRQMQTLLEIAQVQAKELKSYDKLLIEWSKKDPQTRLVQTIPGIGPILSTVIMSELVSLDRFKDGRAFASYCGVTPSVKSSGGKTYLGKSNKHANPYLRWALAEGVYHLIKKDPEFKAKYEHLKAIKGTGKAKVAMMNKMARLIYAVLKRQSPYKKETLPPSD